MAAVLFNGTIGLGSIITVFVFGLGIIGFYIRAQQSDPSEWRNNYLGEVTRREEIEDQLREQRELKHAALTELAALKARTDLQPILVAMNGIADDMKLFATQMKTVSSTQQETVRVMENVTSTQQETVRVLALVAKKLDG